MNSQTYILWETASTFLEWVTEGINQIKSFNPWKKYPDLLKIEEVLLKMLLNFNTTVRMNFFCPFFWTNFAFFGKFCFFLPFFWQSFPKNLF